MKTLEQLIISGQSVLPLIEGGKGIAVSNGQSAGAWAASGAVGTFSGVYGDYYDETGKLIPLIFRGKTRRERSIELTNHAIKAAISQAKIAYDLSGGAGRIHMNVLWGISSVEYFLQEVLRNTKNLIHGVVCGAGLPFRLSEITSQHKVFYYPIVSSARAFNLLWKRSYINFREWLGGVVYEDPWKAGGHNGISNNENCDLPENPYQRVVAIRQMMRECGLYDIPIIMAGGVWFLRDWENWINNTEIGPIAFQFGTRALLTVESPISDGWKQKLLDLDPDEIKSNHFSPTGFHSLAVVNNFIKELQGRSLRQVYYSLTPTEERKMAFVINKIKNKAIYLTDEDNQKAHCWIKTGFNKTMVTPDATLIFVTQEKYNEIRETQINCTGCLAYCRFSNWSEKKELAEDKIPDPRSYCIRRTLYDIAHGGDIQENLMFSGKLAYLFAQDPFYKNGFIPTVKELINRILTGD